MNFSLDALCNTLKEAKNKLVKSEKFDSLT